MEQKRVIENRFELIKKSRSASRKSSLRRWLSEEFIKNNKEIYDKIYAMLENINHKNYIPGIVEKKHLNQKILFCVISLIILFVIYKRLFLLQR